MSASEAKKLVAMIVDDDGVDQMVYQRVFSRSNAFSEVIGCTAADQALAYLEDAEKRPVDVIFLDISMPRMSGFEFLETANRRLGERFEKAAVVILTTSLDEIDKRRARKFKQVKAYLSKPLKSSALDGVVADLGL